MEKKVQLKEQELVGQEVVLSDIYPKTDTTSIEDSSTGESLDVTIDHMLEMINNKLTRVVNSVNSRTGVVVLDADDVGLGNVDNISFSDIQDWVIDEIIKYLAKREILICMNLRQLEDVLATNDPMYDGRTFYVRQIDPSTDVKNYLGMIGKMRYNPTKKTLGTSINDNGIEELLFNLGMMADDENLAVFVQDVKRTDKSLTYDKGFMKVNIAEGEDALYLDEDHNGLAINKNTIRAETHYFKSFYYQKAPSSIGGFAGDSPYHSDFDVHPNGFLLEDNISNASTVNNTKVAMLPVVCIYINGRQCENHYKTSLIQTDPTAQVPDWRFKLHPSISVEIDKTGSDYHKNALHDGDTIIIQGPIQNEMLHTGIYADNDKTSPSLKFQPTLIGKVHLNVNGRGSVIDGDKTVYVDYVYLELHPISQYPSWGLESKAISYVHEKPESTSGLNTEYFSSQMISNVQISTAGDIEDKSNVDENSNVSYSNIQVLSDVNHFDMSNYYPTNNTTKEIYKETTPNETMNAVVTPNGIDKLYTKPEDRRGGLFIPTDMSLCAMPYDQYGISPKKYKAWNDAADDKKSEKSLKSIDTTKIANWGIKSPYYFTDEKYNHNGYLNPPAFLGVNLLKAFIKKSSENYAVPLSGLRVVSSKDARGSDSDTLTWNSFGLYKDVDSDRVLRTYSNEPNPDDEKKDSNKVTINSFSDLVANYVSGGLMVNVGKGLEILPTNVPTNANRYDDFGKVNVRLGDAMKFDAYDRIQVNPGHGLKIDDERIKDDDGNYIKDDDGNFTYEKRLIVDDDVIESTPILKGVRVVGLYNEDVGSDRNGKKYEFKLDPVSLNHERFVEYRQLLELGDGLRWNYTNNDLSEATVYDMTLYQLETFLNTPFKKKDGTEIILKDSESFDYQFTWQNFKATLTRSLVPFGNDEMEIDAYSAMAKINDIRFRLTDLRYSKEFVQRCVSLNRLLWDEVHNGGVKESKAKEKSVKELMDNYGLRHNIEVDDNWSIITWTDTDDNGDATSNVDYIDRTSLSIMESLGETQKSLFNWLLNTISAIKKALSIRDLLYKENMYSAADGLQISFNNKIYNTFSARRGSDTMIGLMFQMMGFDLMELNSAKMIEKTKLKIDNTDSDKFVYIDKPSGSDKYTENEIKPFDILAIRDKDGANGNMMIYTYMDEGSHLYGFTFGNTNNNFMDTICDLERVIEGAITNITYGGGGIGQSPYGDELLTLNNVHAVLRLNEVITPESSGD